MKIFNIIQVSPLKKLQQTNIIGEGVIFSDNHCVVNSTNKKNYNAFSDMAFFDSINHIDELCNLVENFNRNNDLKVQIVFQQNTSSPMQNMSFAKIKSPNNQYSTLQLIGQIKRKNFEECFSLDPNFMCKKCDCWKLTRLNCS